MFLTDAEIAELCYPLTQPAAQVRYLRALKLEVALKPNGRPVVVRSHAESVLSGQRRAQPQAVEQGAQRPDRDGLMELLRGRNGSTQKTQPA